MTAPAAGFETGSIQPLDLLECLQIRPRSMGAEALGTEATLRCWETLLKNEDACGHIAISRQSAAGREIVGFAVGVFVTSQFAEAELATPRPGLNARILESIAANRSVIPDYPYLARANSEGSLHQVILYSHTKDGALTAEEDTLVRIKMAANYAELFMGFNLRRMLVEARDASDLVLIKKYPAIRLVSRYEEFYARHGGGPGEGGLCETVGASFDTDPASAAAPMYVTKSTPVFDLSRGEKALLKGALKGLDDAQLAEAFFRTPAALKRRWSQIFEKVGAIRPDLCPAADGDVRGSQKRHRVLNYIRQHPEEIRPFLASGR